MDDRSTVFWSADAGAAFAQETLALVLCSGRGTRLAPLADSRAKPAVPFGGRYCIVDFAMSNCNNSGVRRIGVLTQYKAESLIRHIQRGWLDRRAGVLVEILPAQQRPHPSEYAGTADAVYQNIDFIRREGPRFVIVLAGDHVYKMDYRRLVADHVARNAEATIACLEVPVAAAKSTFGVMQVAPDFRVIGFEEKPAEPQSLPRRPDTSLASMGIYVFNTEFLCRELIRDARSSASSHDFGHDLIPYLVEEHRRVYAHSFSDSCVNAPNGVAYWRVVGTVEAYWAANIDLARSHPELELEDAEWPITTVREAHPPARFLFGDQHQRGCAAQSLIAGGCVVGASQIRRSTVFSNVRMGDAYRIDKTDILSDAEIGPGSTLHRAVIDEHCKLPAGLVARWNVA